MSFTSARDFILDKTRAASLINITLSRLQYMCKFLLETRFYVRCSGFRDSVVI